MENPQTNLEALWHLISHNLVERIRVVFLIYVAVRLYVTFVNFKESQKLNYFWSVALCQGRELLRDKYSANKKIAKGLRLRNIFIPNHDSLWKLGGKNNKIWARLWVWDVPHFHLCGAKSKMCLWWSQSSSAVKALSSNLDTVTALTHPCFQSWEMCGDMPAGAFYLPLLLQLKPFRVLLI